MYLIRSQKRNIVILLLQNPQIPTSNKISKNYMYFINKGTHRLTVFSVTQGCFIFTLSIGTVVLLTNLDSVFDREDATGS